MRATSSVESSAKRQQRFALTVRAACKTSTPPASTLVAHGPNSDIRFVLARVSSGLYVEREESTGGKPRSLLSMLFLSSELFERWHNADPLRFEDPHIYSRLKVEADRLWCSFGEDGESETR